MYFKTFVILLLIGFALAENLKHKKREVLQTKASNLIDALGSLATTVQATTALLSSIPSQLESGGNPLTIANTLFENLSTLSTTLNSIPILGSLLGGQIQSAISQLQTAIATEDNAQITQVLNTVIQSLSDPLSLLSYFSGIYLQI
jgi:hypothetical protein